MYQVNWLRLNCVFLWPGHADHNRSHRSFSLSYFVLRCTHIFHWDIINLQFCIFLAKSMPRNKCSFSWQQFLALDRRLLTSTAWAQCYGSHRVDQFLLSPCKMTPAESKTQNSSVNCWVIETIHQSLCHPHTHDYLWELFNSHFTKSEKVKTSNTEVSQWMVILWSVTIIPVFRKRWKNLQLVSPLENTALTGGVQWSRLGNDSAPYRYGIQHRKSRQLLMLVSLHPHPSTTYWSLQHVFLLCIMYWLWTEFTFFERLWFKYVDPYDNAS